MALTGADREFIELQFENIRKQVAETHRELEETNRRVDELYRVIRGSSGEVGLMTTISLINQSLTQLSATITRIDDEVARNMSEFQEYRRAADANMATITTFCNTCRSNVLRMENAPTRPLSITHEEENESKRFMSWEWFKEKALWPVVAAIAAILGSELFNMIIASLKHKTP